LLINLLFDNSADFIHQYDTFTEQSEEETNPSPQKEHKPDNRRRVFRTLVVDHKLSLRAAGDRVGVTATTAVQWAIQDGIPYTHRTKYVTDEKRRIAQRMLRKGLPKKTVADAIGCSMTTITRILSANPRLRDVRCRSILSALRAEKRREFLRRISENPGVPIKVLRKAPGSGYSWLYRNDRNWLRENLPTLPHND
jgi:transposase